MSEFSVLIELANGELNLGMSGARLPGVRLDNSYAPIPVESVAGGAAVAMATPSKSAEAPRSNTVVRAMVQDVAEAEDITQRDEVLAVWSDPKIEPFPIDCDSRTSTGTSSDVEGMLQAQDIWNQLGHRGAGIRIGIVDGGVDGSIFRVVGGWSGDPGNAPGSSSVAWNEHGNMCAHDALIASADAEILDYRIARPGVAQTIAAALQAFEHARGSFNRGEGPQILSNSWGLYQTSWDSFPPGHPGNYTHNVNHPFMRKVLELIRAGVIVTFAAGNCGGGCTPGARCGSDVGPGNSIRGANGLDEVICVGAVNLNHEWVGYSSEGPSSLNIDKPDICSYTHFEGHFDVDSGTSAACPVVSGVAGLLYSKRSGLKQHDIKHALTSSSVQLAGMSTPNSRTGHGVVDALAAFNLL